MGIMYLMDPEGMLKLLQMVRAESWFNLPCQTAASPSSGRLPRLCGSPAPERSKRPERGEAAVFTGLTVIFQFPCHDGYADKNNILCKT